FLILASALTKPQLAIADNAEAKPERYNVPLYFNPDDVGVKTVGYRLTWDLTQKNTLKMGALTLDSSSYVTAFFSANSKNNPLVRINEKGAEKDMLFLIWPTAVIDSGTVEMIARDGTVLWSDSFNHNDLKKWQKKIRNAQQRNPEEKQKENRIFFKSGIALNLDAEVLNKVKGSFRFCLTHQNKAEHSMLCSPKNTVNHENGELSIAQISENVDARVIVNREDAALTGQNKVEAGQVVSFFAETSSGVSYEFTTKVLPIQLIDIFKDVDGAVLLSGVDPVPFGAGIYESKNDEDNFWNDVGWQQTIGDLRTYWQMRIPENKEITFPGSGGGAFQLQLDFKDIPTKAERVWISGRDVKVTYEKTRRLHLYHTEKQKLQGSSPEEIIPTTGHPGEIVWNFAAPVKGNYNISKLEIIEEPKSWKGSYEIYRGYSSELSGRFTGAIDSNMKSIIIGELSYNKWFQNLWGWDDDTWSNFRWGISADYFKSLSSMEVGESSKQTSKTDLNVMSLMLKYRFNPGLWGRDETWGLVGGYQNVSFLNVQAPLLGAGFFWARSMPKLFDDLFSSVPLLNHPKFVDMEVVYLPLSLDSNISVGNSFLVKFHGKVLWSQTLFGEAGFGVKSYQMTDQKQSFNVELGAFYLTFGVGMNF
ncbi:MAG: hypothetical protein ACXVCR_17995, partial [Bdellovibrio sp.]